jgi:hypothetical protein
MLVPGALSEASFVLDVSENGCNADETVSLAACLLTQTVVYGLIRTDTKFPFGVPFAEPEAKEIDVEVPSQVLSFRFVCFIVNVVC